MTVNIRKIKAPQIKDSQLQIEVLFVHLGTAPAPHLWQNIKRTQYLFPWLRISVLIDEAKHIKKVPHSCGLLLRDKMANKEKSWRNARDQKFRRGFWIHSLDRLFILEESQELLGCPPILHIESDILLSRTFPWSEITRLDRCAWQNYNEERDVASLVWLPEVTKTKEFMSDLREVLSKNNAHTDMTILRDLIVMYPHKYAYLPSAEDLRDIDANRFSSRELFKDGFFDSASIGMWLLGHDPRNTYGKFILHDNSTFVNSKLKINPAELKYGFESMTGPYVKAQSGKKLQIWSLHVHSKELRLFGENSDANIMKYIELAQKNPENIHGFRPRAIFSMFIDNLATRSVHRFFGGIPLVHRVRRVLFLGRKRVFNILKRSSPYEK